MQSNKSTSKRTGALERREVLEGFQKDILGQFFGIFLVGDDAGHQDEYLLAVCVEKMLVKSSLSPQDALDDMSLVVFHFVC